MNNLPWFPLDAKQWLVGTAGMTKAEKGVFIDLLCYQWENGSLSGIPNRLPVECADEWVVLQSKFVESTSGDLVNSKLHKIRLEKEALLDKQVEGGRKGARVRYGSPTRKAIGIQSKSKSKKLEKEPEESKSPAIDIAEKVDKDFILTKRKRKLKGLHLNLFLEFWDAFGDKRGKIEAADAWLDIQWQGRHIEGYFKEKILPGAKAYAAHRQDLIKNGSTPKMAQGWIAARRWEDEIPKTEADPGDINWAEVEKESGGLYG